MTYSRIDEEHYQKAIGQFRLQLNGIMSCFRCYGLGNDVNEASEEIVRLAENFGMLVRGKDAPIAVRATPRRRPTE